MKKKMKKKQEERQKGKLSLHSCYYDPSSVPMSRLVMI